MSSIEGIGAGASNQGAQALRAEALTQATQIAAAAAQTAATPTSNVSLPVVVPTLVDAAQLAAAMALLQLNLTQVLAAADHQLLDLINATLNPTAPTPEQMQQPQPQPGSGTVLLPPGFTPSLDFANAVPDVVELSDAEVEHLANAPAVQNPSTSAPTSSSSFVSRLIRPTLFADQLFSAARPVGTSATPVSVLSQAFVGASSLVFGAGEQSNPMHVVVLQGDFRGLAQLSPKEVSNVLQRALLDAIHQAFGDNAPISASVTVDREGIAHIEIIPRDPAKLNQPVVASFVSNAGYQLIADTRTPASNKLALLPGSPQTELNEADRALLGGVIAGPTTNSQNVAVSRDWASIFANIKPNPEHQNVVLPFPAPRNAAEQQQNLAVLLAARANGNGAQIEPALYDAQRNTHTLDNANRFTGVPLLAPVLGNDAADELVAAQNRANNPAIQQAAGWFGASLLNRITDPDGSTPWMTRRVLSYLAAALVALGVWTVLPSSTSIGATLVLFAVIGAAVAILPLVRNARRDDD